MRPVGHGVPLVYRFLLPLALVLFATAGLASSYLAMAMRDRIVEASVTDARLNIEQFKELRAYYTKNVVAKATAEQRVRVGYSHKEHADMIPLPATMIHELSERFAGFGGNKLRLYSAFGFPNRAGRELDGFANDALAALELDPESTFSRTESMGGSEYVRVAIADRMVSDTCVTCHNTHPETPKNDWEIGDVRGVLEIDIPVGTRIEAAHQTANTAIAVIVGLFMLAFAVMSIVLVRSTRRLAKASRSLRKEADLIQKTSNHILESAKLTAESCKGQAHTAAENVYTMEKVGHVAKNTVEITSDLNIRVEEVESQVQIGRATMLELEGAMSTLGESATELNELSTLIHEISERTQMITGIVLSTRLLGINASIEAARAGENGQGFGVVAEEIGVLSKYSGDAAKSIDSLVGDGSTRVASFLKSTNDRIVRGSKAGQEARAVFEKIAQEMKTVREGLENAAENNETQQQDIQQANRTVAQSSQSSHQASEAGGVAVRMAEELQEQRDRLAKIATEISDVVLGSRGSPNQ